MKLFFPDFRVLPRSVFFLLFLFVSRTACAAEARGPVERFLSALFRPVNEALGSIPLGAARWFAVGYIVLGALWTLLLPRKYIYLGAPSEARWRDLRLWAFVFLLPFALIYLFW